MTLKQFYRKYDKRINSAITSALKEDGTGRDVTTNLLGKKNSGEKLKAVLLCKQDCVLAGLEIFKKVYRQIDPSVKFKSYYKDGSKIAEGKKVLEITTSRGNLLTGERTALNFLQRMSGTATLTREFVKKLKYKNSKVLHTRKTTPNFRLFEAAAVKTGGGGFHRLSLDSSVLIKDNHIIAAGGIENLMDLLRKQKLPNTLKHKFEIEVKTFKELETVIKKGKGVVKVVMLDNFQPSQLDKAVSLAKQAAFEIEVSGGLNLKNFEKYQKKGINYYSIGALTHSYRSVDFSLEF